MFEIALALSLHVNMSGEFNELHPHVRYDDGQTIVGAYLNSQDRISPYVGLKVPTGPVTHELGLVANYEQAPVLPLYRAVASIGRLPLRVFVAPTLSSDREPAFVLGAEWAVRF